MVVRITNGKNVRGAVRYNEQKVANGEAEILLIANYPSHHLAQQSIGNRVMPLEYLAQKNSRVTQSALHFVLAFHHSEQISDDKQKAIASNFMDRMGYGKQPFLVYRHDDTSHPHLHIVTVAVDRQGKKINDSFTKHRCNKARQELEIQFGLIQAEGRDETSRNQKHADLIAYGQQPTKAALGSVVRMAMKEYSFSNFGQFESFLRSYNVHVKVHLPIPSELNKKEKLPGITYQVTDGVEARSPSIKASRFAFNPTWSALQKQFTAGASSKKTDLPLIQQTVSQVIKQSPSDESTFKNQLRAIGIQLLEEDNGYLYIDQKRKRVYSESELGESYHRLQLLKQFENAAKQPAVISTKIQNTETESTDPILKQVIRRTAYNFQQIRKESPYYFESQLIQNFPHAALIDRLVGEGLGLATAAQSSRQFEAYKQGQLPEIIAKEQAYFELNTRAYFELAQRMPITGQSRQAFLQSVHLEIHPIEEGNYQLRHRQYHDLSIAVSKTDYKKLMNDEFLADVSFPMPLHKEERSLYLMIAQGKTPEIGALNEDIQKRLYQSLPESERTRILPQLKPTQDLATIPPGLNKATETEKLPTLPVAKSPKNTKKNDQGYSLN